MDMLEQLPHERDPNQLLAALLILSKSLDLLDEHQQQRKRASSRETALKSAGWHKAGRIPMLLTNAHGSELALRGYLAA